MFVYFFQVDDAVLSVSLPYKEYFLFAEVIKVMFNFTIVAVLFCFTLVWLSLIIDVVHHYKDL